MAVVVPQESSSKTDSHDASKFETNEQYHQLHGGGGGSSKIFGLNSSSTSWTSCEFNEEDIKLPLHLV